MAYSSTMNMEETRYSATSVDVQRELQKRVIRRMSEQQRN
jgi:hypothetical protein